MSIFTGCDVVLLQRPTQIVGEVDGLVVGGPVVGAWVGDMGLL